MFIFDRLRVELDEVIGSKSIYDQDDLAKLSYTNCVYKETLRLWVSYLVAKCFYSIFAIKLLN